jgi:hypothetical protein
VCQSVKPEPQTLDPAFPLVYDEKSKHKTGSGSAGGRECAVHAVCRNLAD